DDVSDQSRQLSGAAGSDSLVLHCGGRIAYGGDDLWTEVPRREALDQDARRQPLPALRMGEADSDIGSGEVLCRFAASRTFLAGLYESRSHRRDSNVAGLEAAGLGHGSHLYSHRNHGSFSGRNALEA